jgi:hypothetical protein
LFARFCKALGRPTLGRCSGLGSSSCIHAVVIGLSAGVLVASVALALRAACAAQNAGPAVLSPAGGRGAELLHLAGRIYSGPPFRRCCQRTGACLIRNRRCGMVALRPFDLPSTILLVPTRVGQRRDGLHERESCTSPCQPRWKSRRTDPASNGTRVFLLPIP